MIRHSLALSAALACSAAGAHAQSLTTTFVSDNGRSTPDPGCFFDLNVLSPRGVYIHQLDVNVIGTIGADAIIDVYVTPGTYVGNDTNPAAWTKTNPRIGRPVKSIGTQPLRWSTSS